MEYPADLKAKSIHCNEDLWTDGFDLIRDEE